MSEHNTIWSIWVDELNKVIFVKKTPNLKELKFESKEIGIETINKFISRGFKIG